MFLFTVHFYDYKNDCWNPDTFPKPRFASEYGYQSYPTLDELREATKGFEGQLFWNSSLLFHRQHHAHGKNHILRRKKMLMERKNDRNVHQQNTSFSIKTFSIAVPYKEPFITKSFIILCLATM